MNLTEHAEASYRRGDPIPLDQTTELLSRGIDPEALEDSIQLPDLNIYSTQNTGELFNG